MTPTLNWKELAEFIKQIGPEVEGLFVERVMVPERGLFPGGYLKGEWALRLTGKRQECTLVVSIRPRHPYIALYSGKGPKVCSTATRSPFDLNLSKQLKGSRLLRSEVLPRERAAVFWFSEAGSTEGRLAWVISLIPSHPEAFLISSSDYEIAGKKTVARSRTLRGEKAAEAGIYELPLQNSKAPDDVKVRSELISTPFSFSKIIEECLQQEAFTVRYQAALKATRQLLKQARDRARQSETALKEAQKEEDWQRLGDLLKGSLGDSTAETREKVRYVLDYNSSDDPQKIAIPCDPALDLPAQIQKFYHQAKRKQRRISEAQSRLNRFHEAITKLSAALDQTMELGNWNALTALEQLAGTPPAGSMSPDTAGGAKKPAKKQGFAWLGKVFQSRDGIPIYVGRDKDENLELTFKHARGNDLWMHVRGRPGAHCVIPVPAGKSIPLETLLDAANLTLFYSRGEKWGKTEVDYTFKKYVKRIKDSTEASYTHNKTLLVECDRARLDRLLGTP